MIQSLPRWLMLAALAAPAVAVNAQTVNPLPPETRLVSLSSAPAATEETFNLASAQDLAVTLTDLQVPAALTSATVVVTQGGMLVGNATLASPATSASLTVTGAVGQFTLRVFGSPGSTSSVGTFTVCVAPKTNPANCIQSASLAGNISAPGAAADPTLTTISEPLTVTTAGAYTVSFADDQFPVALNVAPNLALFQGSTVIATAIPSGTVVNLSPGTYTLLGIAQADQTIKAGLFGVTISAPAGVASLLDNTFPVGALNPGRFATNPSAQTLSLNVVDFAFPAALASAAAAVSAGGQKLGVAASGASATSFSAPQGVLQVWSFAAAGTDAGTYEVDLTSPSASLLQTVAGVANGSSLAFGYETATLASGTYQATVSDFQFPAALQGLKLAVAQNGVVLQKITAAGNVNFTAAAGPVALLVDATAPASGNGLFDVNVQSTPASPTLLFDKTQGVSVGSLFDTQTINLGTSGNFDVTLTDLDFPSPFQDLALVVSSGGSILGKIFGGGTFTVSAMPGAYQLTFIATPSAQQQYGLYAVQMTYSAPQVTLTATPTTVITGAVTTLNWTTSNATSCTAAGGSWSGSPATGSGTIALSVTATTTYTLTCTGPGGSTAKSVTVTAAPAPASSHGGGAMDLFLTALLAALAAARFRPRFGRHFRDVV